MRQLRLDFGRGGSEVGALGFVELGLEIGEPLRSSRGTLQTLQSRRQFIAQQSGAGEVLLGALSRRRRDSSI